VTSEPELLVLPPQWLYLSPPLAFLHSEGEVHAERMRYPALCEAGTPNSKGDLQVPRASPCQKYFPPCAVRTPDRIPHGNEPLSKLLQALPHRHRGGLRLLGQDGPPWPVPGDGELAGHRTTHDVTIFLPTSWPSCSQRRTVRGAIPSTVAASVTESTCIVAGGIRGFPFLSFSPHGGRRRPVGGPVLPHEPASCSGS
jgi:hypothetical protein